ncbi:chemotaxis protein CheX [Spirochaeta thermophila]|uniref:CheC, inhibitor of MCP methylation n=1 Tax=Winmispira thermophila (strain ATCC 49972 / DSM 6192 / RI 19.B1) TaxID=665571 RepID=E0RPM8_WINT6|nr:chemotaxis protein CheX [Spirochaeta thermophila]ADN01342.1 CheC, inhibitor of MCP methylation [Spirochaeta thermophila DSM 6192]
MKISEVHLDYLKELMNMGVGRAARVLGSLLNAPIELKVPEIYIYTKAEILKEFSAFPGDRISSVLLPFDGVFTGLAFLLFPPQSAQHLISLLVQEMDEDEDLDEIRAGTLSEIGNIVLNSIMGTFSNFFSSHIHYTVPSYTESRPEELFQHYTKAHKEYSFLLARTRFTVSSLNIEGDIVILMEVTPFQHLLKEIDAHYESIVRKK